MIDKQKLDEALISMGKKPLHDDYKPKWCEKCPTRGYCIIVSLLVLHYDAPEGSSLYKIKVPNGETHYYVKTLDGKRLDYTKDQYDFTFSYEGERKSPTKYNSKMPYVKKLAELLGLELTR
jgi:hypothetical protein